MIDPNKDGVDHINIYSKGQTCLGRYMSNFAYFSFVYNDEHFPSVEHWWYYQLTQNDDCFLSIYLPATIKKRMQEYIKNNNIETKQIDKHKLKEILTNKILSNHSNLVAFINSSLPFKHYYTFGDKVVLANEQFLTDIWEEIRIELKTNLSILLNKYMLRKGMFYPAKPITKQISKPLSVTEVQKTMFTYVELKNELINKKVDTFLDDLFSDGAAPTKPDPFNESW